MRADDETKDEVVAPETSDAKDEVGEVPSIEVSKKLRAHLQAKRDKARLVADEAFNAERAGLLVSRATVDAMLADMMVSIKGGLALAHRTAIETLPHPHRAGMEVALRQQTADMFSNLALAQAMSPSAGPTREAQSERRDQKKERRARVATSGKARGTTPNRRAKPKGKSGAK